MDSNRYITLGQCGPGSNGNEGVLYISQIPEPEPHHLMQFNILLRTDKVLIINEQLQGGTIKLSL